MFVVTSCGVFRREKSGAMSWVTAEDRREGALARLDAFAASRADQSRSVLGMRESPGVRGEGEAGLEFVAEGGFEPSTLGSRETSALMRGDRDGDVGTPLAADPSRDTGRETKLASLEREYASAELGSSDAEKAAGRSWASAREVDVMSGVGRRDLST